MVLPLELPGQSDESFRLRLSFALLAPTLRAEIRDVRQSSSAIKWVKRTHRVNAHSADTEKLSYRRRPSQVGTERSTLALCTAGKADDHWSSLVMNGH